MVVNVFNGHRQLVSDIGYYVVTWIPLRKLLMFTRIILFDFELFVGGLHQLVSDIN